MLNFRNVIFLGLLIKNIVLAIPSCATEEVSLDLLGNGHFTTIQLAFSYYERQPEDRLNFIHELGYKVYNIHDNNITQAAKCLYT